MLHLLALKVVATRVIGRVGLEATRHAPEILMGAGIIAGVGAIVAASRAGEKKAAITAENEKDIQYIEKVNENNPDKYSEEEYHQALGRQTIKNYVRLGKLYITPVTLGAISAGCFLGSYRILSLRNAGLAAAFEIVNASYKKYRERFKEIGGTPEEDMYLRHGIKPRWEANANGDPKEFTKSPAVLDLPKYLQDGKLSMYAEVFGSANPNWKRSESSNRFFLEKQEEWQNERLQARGYLFLNEVLKDLGFQPTTSGCIVGWVYGQGDSFVSFGLDNPENFRSSDSRTDSNGFDPLPYVLDFNVDGEIYRMMDGIREEKEKHYYAK